MSIPHPIPYQGSKRNLAHQILRYLPETGVARLIEPFAGSAAVSLAAAYHGRANAFLLNDINAPLIALWDEIITRPGELAGAYAALWHAQQGREREYYDDVRDRFNETQRPDYFLYLLARCVKAAVRYNTAGEFNQSPDNRRKGTRPARMRQRLAEAAKLLNGRTVLMATDYREVLKLASSEDIVYMDPPYQGVCATSDPRYIQGVEYAEFAAALADLNQRGIPFMVSYDGRTGQKAYGKPLPAHLNLMHLEINAGRSSQATLLGRQAKTVEALYLSPALIDRLDKTVLSAEICDMPEQLPLFSETLT